MPANAEVVGPWKGRWTPPLAWLRRYALFAIGVLLAVVAAAVLNVAVPLGKGGLAHVVQSGLVLIAAGAVLLLVPAAIAVPWLRPAGWATLALVPLVAVLLIVGLWGTVAGLGRALAASLVLLAGVYAIAPGMAAASRAAMRMYALAATVLVAAPALLLAGLALAGGHPARLMDSAFRLVLWSLLASFILLVRSRRPAAVGLAWAAVAQLAVGQALDPWLDGPAATRMLVAGFVVAGCLLACAGLLAAMPGRREAVS
jgi:hypothetical protein